MQHFPYLKGIIIERVIFILSKIILTVLVIMCFVLFPTSNKNTVVNSDYMNISYNNHTYTLMDNFVGMPDDVECITPTVEGQGIIDKLDPLTYNEVYVSDSSSKYIWLKTTTDCTNNPKFEEVSKTKAILSYRIVD